MIRRALFADVARIVEMGKRFVSETEYQALVPINHDCMTSWVTQLVSGFVGSESAVFLSVHDETIVGMLGIFVYPSPLTGQKEAVEVFWWVEPEHRGGGLRLMKHAEQWAREGGALTLRMIAPNQQVERMYERLGFRRVESSYERAI